MAFEYGEKVTFWQIYRRGSETRTTTNKRGNVQHGSHWKVWRRKFYKGSGLFLGYRWLQEGVREYDSEYGYVFSAIGRFKAALVSPGYLVNPVYVPLDAIEKVDA